MWFKWLFLSVLSVFYSPALEAVQSELFEVKSKYDEATSAKWVHHFQIDMFYGDIHFNSLDSA